ncbi:MAG TPA: KGG domain-containing protein [Gemmatimonadaceae bacterium]|jgi:general stress protein YciG|nr:KGG domain-containing protein [Gemmatimonadaceae bacterium]
MPNRPGNDDRMYGATGGIGDRGGQRDSSSDNARQNGSQGSGNTGSGQSRSRSNRGFASMDRGKQREIASKGGKAAHAKGTAHEFDSSEAREAGRKGGVAVSRNREHMAAIGRRGGEARGQSRSRVSGQTNTGAESTLEGGVQNTRAASDRQVSIQNEGVNADTLGNRGGNSSLGGERRPQGAENESREDSF